MTSNNVTEAETVEPSEPVPPKSVDDRLIDELVGRAQVEGLQLTGEGGLLQQLTKRLLESALEGEITDHLGYDKHDPAGSPTTPRCDASHSGKWEVIADSPSGRSLEIAASSCATGKEHHMAMLCYSDLEDDDRVGVSTLHAVLEDWVLRLLVDTQDRATWLPEPFTSPQAEDCPPEDTALALRTIRFLRYAQAQLLNRNAHLRYLCQDCPRDGQTLCPARNRPRPAGKAVHEAVYAVRIEPLPVQRGAWLAQARPATSLVLERLHRMAKQLTGPAPGAGKETARRAFVHHLYEMARMWREQGLPDHAANVDQEQDGAFAQEVMGALLQRKEHKDTDARHSPVNFVAAVLHTLAGQLSGPEAFTTREAVMAALMARNACIEGDTAAVDEFSRTWLNLGRPQAWRAAVEMALLGDWVKALGQHLRDDAEIMELLHRHTEREHRLLQPLWERKSGGRTVRLLEDPVASGVSLRDVITDDRRPEDGLLRGETEDSRILAVLADLTPAEGAVAMAYSTQRMTWPQAAALVGADDPDAFGNRVRRKLRRLGLRHRAAASSSTPVPAEGR